MSHQPPSEVEQERAEADAQIVVRLKRAIEGDYWPSLNIAQCQRLIEALQPAAQPGFVVELTTAPTPDYPPCAVCGTPYSQHGSYPTCASHRYTEKAFHEKQSHDYPACALFRGGKCTCD